MLASDGEKVGRTNNVPRGKGTNREKATLTDLTLEALVNSPPPPKNVERGIYEYVDRLRYIR